MSARRTRRAEKCKTEIRNKRNRRVAQTLYEPHKNKELFTQFEEIMQRVFGDRIFGNHQLN